MTAPRSDHYWARVRRDLLAPDDGDWVDVLVAKHIAGEASAAEEAELRDLMASDPAVREFLESAVATYASLRQPARWARFWAVAAAGIPLVGHVLLSFWHADGTLAYLDYWSDVAWNVTRFAVFPAVLIVLAAILLKWKGYLPRRRVFNAIALGVLLVAVGAVWVLSEMAAGRRSRSLEAVLEGRRWITFEPPGFKPIAGVVPTEEELKAMPAEDALERQLALLHGAGGFDGVITFGVEGTLDQIPRLAKKVGFHSVIVGVRVPKVGGKPVRPDLDRAKSVAAYADAYCLGHNAVQSVDLSVLAEWMRELRVATDKPVTMTAPIGHYVGVRGQALRSFGDFYFPDVVPGWRFGDGPRQAIEALHRDLDKVSNLPPQKFCLLKMVSFPSDGSKEATPENQVEFFTQLTRDTVLPPRTAVSIFNGFDLPWKTGSDWADTEKHVGLFYADEKPKPALKVLREGFPVQYKP